MQDFPSTSLLRFYPQFQPAHKLLPGVLAVPCLPWSFGSTLSCSGLKTVGHVSSIVAAWSVGSTLSTLECWLNPVYSGMLALPCLLWNVGSALSALECWLYPVYSGMLALPCLLWNVGSTLSAMEFWFTVTHVSGVVAAWCWLCPVYPGLRTVIHVSRYDAFGLRLKRIDLAAAGLQVSLMVTRSCQIAA